jgi:hypothetical protein
MGHNEIDQPLFTQVCHYNFSTYELFLALHCVQSFLHVELVMCCVLTLPVCYRFTLHVHMRSYLYVHSLSANKHHLPLLFCIH